MNEEKNVKIFLSLNQFKRWITCPHSSYAHLAFLHGPVQLSYTAGLVVGWQYESSMIIVWLFSTRRWTHLWFRIRSPAPQAAEHSDRVTSQLKIIYFLFPFTSQTKSKISYSISQWLLQWSSSIFGFFDGRQFVGGITFALSDWMQMAVRNLLRNKFFNSNETG